MYSQKREKFNSFFCLIINYPKCLLAFLFLSLTIENWPISSSTFGSIYQCQPCRQFVKFQFYTGTSVLKSGLNPISCIKSGRPLSGVRHTSGRARRPRRCGKKKALSWYWQLTKKETSLRLVGLPLGVLKEELTKMEDLREERGVRDLHL